MSVGHASRVIEEAGIPTVCVFIRAFRHQARRVKPARTLLTKHILGRTIGAPGDVARQSGVVRAALALLEAAVNPGAIREFAETYPATDQKSPAAETGRPAAY